MRDGIMVNIDMPGGGGLGRAVDKLTDIFERYLMLGLRELAESIVDDMQRQLYPGHGYDTGKLYKGLKIKMVRLALSPRVEITAEDVDYWMYVEFGHALRDGTWWEGYHFVDAAVKKNLGSLNERARVAWHLAANEWNITTGNGRMI